MRAIVACFEYDAQTAASGAILARLLRDESLHQFHPSNHMLGHLTLEVVSCVVIWDLELLIIQNGLKAVREYRDRAGPAVWVVMLLLAIRDPKPSHFTQVRRRSVAISVFASAGCESRCRISLEMLRLVTSVGGFSFQHTIPSDVPLKETKDVGVQARPAASPRYRCWPQTGSTVPRCLI